MTSICRHVLVSGRVQGVAYRWSAAARARDLELAGWVRNLPDGRVEALLSGPAPAVASMLSWMEQGPPAAEVQRVQASEAPACDAEGFEIRT
ncbi:MAG: acylphosphatase [Planctomycetota bacterium]|nr:MAG: acylphosphatase [Planctomycetota bacterium]